MKYILFILALALVGCNAPTHSELVHKQASIIAGNHQTVSPKQWDAYIRDTQSNPSQYRKEVLAEVKKIEAQYGMKSRTWSDSVVLGK